MFSLSLFLSLWSLRSLWFNLPQSSLSSKHHLRPCGRAGYVVEGHAQAVAPPFSVDRQGQRVDARRQLEDGLRVGLDPGPIAPERQPPGPVERELHRSSPLTLDL